jgi:pyruvate dehydrogenase E2 component (dihydrolipoamide acetyltransferase)
VANSIEVKVPDIGGFKDVNVIDVLVKDGQQVDKETPLVTIETEKAAMDVPSPVAGKIAQVKLKTGDKVSEGSLILTLEAAAEAAAPPAEANGGDKDAAKESEKEPAKKSTQESGREGTESAKQTGKESGQDSAKESGRDSAKGTDKESAKQSAGQDSSPPAKSRESTPAPAAAKQAAPAGTGAMIDEKAFSQAHASPSIRKFARELGADLGQVHGTGIKGRITQEDVKAHVKSLLSRVGSSPGSASALPKVPTVDFAQFGAVDVKPLSRIQKISGSRLQASWLNLPHVTQHEDADITELEEARTALKAKASEQGVRLTPLAFIVKACILSLQEFPRFNASLDESGENLVFKKYFNIGFAADTPNGLVVPVIANADRLSIFDIARQLGEMAEKARGGKLKAKEMQGGSFTITSLGGIGGTYFTPIINAPEVAILGVSKSSLKPVYERGAFLPRLMLPLSLSYDHRVIDGAEAARFAVHLAKVLGDPKALV